MDFIQKSGCQMRYVELGFEVLSGGGAHSRVPVSVARRYYCVMPGVVVGRGLDHVDGGEVLAEFLVLGVV